jgi:hypothetical protein
MAQALTPEQARYLIDNGLRRILRPDPDLPHQIVIRGSDNGRIGVSCNCRLLSGDGRSANSSYVPLEVRSCWKPGEAAARWRQHVAEAEAVAARG